MKSGIYQIRNLINQKIYVGSTVDFNDRWSHHLSELKNKRHHSPYLQYSWYKYGSKNFAFQILEYVPEQNLEEVEQYYLDWMEPWKSENGYNTCPTAQSCLGRPVTKETREKISKARKGKKLSEEHKNKIRETTKGREGNPCSKETRTKLREINLGKHEGEKNHFFGKKHSDETRKKMVDARIKNPFSEETIKKMSEAKVGKNNHNFGKSRSADTKKKISESNSGENGKHAILTWNKVREIRNRYKEGQISRAKLALEYGVSTSCIQHIIENDSWKES